MLRPRRGLNWRLSLVLGVLTALMALTIWLNFSAAAKLEQLHRGVTATAAVIHANQDMFGLLQDLESSQRGYLLTRRPAYLEPYNRYAGEVDTALRRLREATTPFPEYAKLISDIDRVVPLKLKEMSRGLELAQAGEWDAVRTVIESDIGKNTMAGIREIIMRIEATALADRARIIEDTAQGQTRLLLSSIAIGILALVWPIVAILNLVRINRGLQEEVVRRRAVESGLRELEERNRAFFEHASDYLYIVEQRPDGQWFYTHINPAMARLLGRSEEQVRGRPIAEVIGAGTAAVSIANFQRCQETRAGVRYANRAQFDGETYDFDVSLIPLTDKDGAIRRLLASARDITQAKLTEAALVQSQRMEVVGQLTGGIAHDFNNLLQVVIGNIELAGNATGEEGVKQRLAAAQSAAAMGQQLTRKLLAFARQAPTAVKIVDPAAIIKDMEPMMRASLGEKVALQVTCEKDLWRIAADRSSFESAILNLAINARDAMPKGGSLRIDLANVVVNKGLAARHSGARHGEHLRIAVTDTGVGMAPEMLPKVFTPFFTTKGAGKGSGLGLATVYSMTRDRGGFVAIESGLGVGTTVTLYFPRSSGVLALDAPLAGAVVGGSESVLVVEDDRQLLDIAVEMLRGLGYAVEATHSADTALEILSSGRQVELLFTDVVMPGRFNGVGLAYRAQALRPGLRVLFMSGYIDDPAVREAAASGNLQVLQKPFSSQQLAAAVRAALDGGQPGMRAGVVRAGGGRLDFRAAKSGRSILVVEDNPLVRVVAVDALTIAGFRCIEADTAAEALRCLGDRNISIDAMVTDLNLPDQPGATLVRESGVLRPSMPVIISTGTSVSDADPLVQSRPGVSFLQKPYSPELLVRRVTDITR